MQFTPAQKTAAAWFSIAAAIGVLLWLLGAVLTPFVVAAVLAYALAPLVKRLTRARVPLILAVGIVQTAFFIVMLGVLLLIVPILVKEIPLMREQAPVLLDRLDAWLRPLLAQFGLGVSLDVDSLKGFVRKYLDANMEEAMAQLLSSLKLGGSVALALIGNAVLIPVALFYLLMDWDRFVERARSAVPVRLRSAVDSFAEEADSVLGQYLHGQLLVMGILAVYYAGGLALFGLDLALPIGVFTGLAIFVPYLGFGIGLLLALVAGLLQFASAKALIMVAVIFGIGQVVESIYLTPRLVGERVGLHPLAVIFALLAFGQVFGFIGILVALPASAVLLVAMRRMWAAYQGSALYRS